MLALRRNSQLTIQLLRTTCCYISTESQNQSGEVVVPVAAKSLEDPQYPKIQDLSYRSRKKRKQLAWHEEIRRLNTVEEKLIKINMPHYWGYKVIHLGNEKFPYNCLRFTQYCTRTALEDLQFAAPMEEKGEKTEKDKKMSPKLEALVQSAKPEVQDGLEYAYDFFMHKYKNCPQLEPKQREEIFTQIVVEQINRALINSLASDCSHLYEVEIDYRPRHEAFWSVGGINPSKNVVKSKEGQTWQKEMAKDPVDRWFQYKGMPYLSIRHRNQLSPWKNETETTMANLAKQIPIYKFDPRTLGYSTGNLHGTNVPGFWPGSPNGFGCISYHSRAYMQHRPISFGPDDFKEALHAQGIQASFAWLLGQANYMGFNTFNEVTYPLNTQTVITNGRDWSFFEYQLNTVLVHSENVDKNARVNFCRGTGEMQLYQDFDAKGHCVGFNEEVVRHLVLFYSNAPKLERKNNELQPFLDVDCKYIADYTNEEKRVFLENTFKHMTANRPRKLEQPEYYLWEKIYKIDNKTRQMEAKRRFFELGINPWKRTLDQHQKEYIPRVLRSEGPKSRKKWKQTYYP